jgi:linoleoyl-CoA desaturase
MKSIKITYQNRNCDFTRELKAAVDEYFRKTKKSKVGGWALWTEAAVALLLYLGPLVLLYAGVVSNIFWALGLGLVMGVGYLMVGSDIMHAANHGTFSKSKRVNRFFSYSMELLGMSSRNWRVQHNDLHHMHTNIIGENGDSDLHAGEPIVRYSKFSDLKGFIIRYQHIYVWVMYAFAFILWIFNKDFNSLFQYYREGRYRFRKGRKPSLTLLSIEMIAFKLVYVFLFLALPVILGTSIWLVLVMWLSTTMFAAAIMMPVFQMAHAVDEIEQFEAGKMNVSWMIHQIRTSADIRASLPWVNWLFTHIVGGLNYQKVHHLFRDVAHTHYPALSKIVDEHIEKYKIESVTFTSIRSALASHYRMMKSLATSPDLSLG